MKKRITKEKRILIFTLSCFLFSNFFISPISNATCINQEDQIETTLSTCQQKDFIIPEGFGTLTSNVWRSTQAETSGNSLQWDYQVSAVYSGDYQVERIRTTFEGSASLRSSASISIGISTGGVSASSSSSWQTIKTSGYFENTKGQTSSDYRSNMIVSPKKDYRTDTVTLTNTALVKIHGYAKTYHISAAV